MKVSHGGLLYVNIIEVGLISKISWDYSIGKGCCGKRKVVTKVSSSSQPMVGTTGSHHTNRTMCNGVFSNLTLVLQSENICWSSASAEQEARFAGGKGARGRVTAAIPWHTTAGLMCLPAYQCTLVFPFRWMVSGAARFLWSLSRGCVPLCVWGFMLALENAGFTCLLSPFGQVPRLKMCSVNI